MVIGSVLITFGAFEVGTQGLMSEEGGGKEWLKEGSNKIIGEGEKRM